MTIEICNTGDVGFGITRAYLYMKALSRYTEFQFFK